MSAPRSWHGNVFFGEDPNALGFVRRCVYEGRILDLLLRDDLIGIEWRACASFHEGGGSFVAKKNVHKEHWWKLYVRHDKMAVPERGGWTREVFQQNIHTKDLLLLHWKSLIPTNPVLGILREEVPVQPSVDEQYIF